MEDWRLQGNEDFLENAVVYRIKFPEYWEKMRQSLQRLTANLWQQR